MDLTRMNKHSAHVLATSAVTWSCLAGFELGWGMQGAITNYKRYAWIHSFLFGSVALALGIFWVVLLVRRMGTDGASSSTSNVPS
jgi:hypothetical protein